MIKKLQLAILPILSAFFLASDLSAHPHLFIDSHVTVVFDQKGLAGFKMKWIFDEMSASTYIMDYDTDSDGVFNDKEFDILKEEAFDNLKNYDYMTSIFIENKEFKVQFVKDFYAEIVKGRLIYYFTIPCHVRAISQEKDITIAVYDKEFFVDFTFNKRIKFEESSKISYSYSIEKNLNKSYYMDQLHPTELQLGIRKR